MKKADFQARVTEIASRGHVPALRLSSYFCPSKHLLSVISGVPHLWRLRASPLSLIHRRCFIFRSPFALSSPAAQRSIISNFFAAAAASASRRHSFPTPVLRQFRFKSPNTCICSKVKVAPMDNIVDSLSKAYQEFVAAAAGVLEARESSGGQKTAATDAALENFKQCWELFRVACDQAEEFVESVKQRIGSECLVDEATGSVAGKPGQAATTGLPPISAVRLEQMSKAVRWLVIELQHGSGNAGGSSHPHPSAPFDARFSEDAAQ